MQTLYASLGIMCEVGVWEGGPWDETIEGRRGRGYISLLFSSLPIASRNYITIQNPPYHFPQLRTFFNSRAKGIAASH